MLRQREVRLPVATIDRVDQRVKRVVYIDGKRHPLGSGQRMMSRWPDPLGEPKCAYFTMPASDGVMPLESVRTT